MSIDTDAMSLDERIGHVFMVGFRGHTPTPEILSLIAQQHVAGIILFSRNIGQPQDVLTLTNHLQQHAKNAGHRYPLLIAIDQENGMVQRMGAGITHFPGNMALGAIGDAQTAYDVALATGRELKALGINMNLAPDVDVNNNPHNPIIGVRSFGEDPHLVAQLGVATVRGLHAAGVITTLKHFPGHGDTTVDSHLALPVLPHTLERLHAVELVPFTEAIQAGADCVMTAHIHFTSLLHNETLPASVSHTVIQQLLRTQLGFQGVVISDCMEMQAIASALGTEQAAVLAIQAGTSLVLVSHTYDRQLSSIEAVRQQAQQSSDMVEAIHRAAEQVIALKSHLLSWDDLPATTVPAYVHGPAHQALSASTYARSTTLVRNDDQLIPLQLTPDTRLLVLTQQKERFAIVQDRAYPSVHLAACIRQRHARTDVRAIAPLPGEREQHDILQAAQEADCILIATVNASLVPQEAALVRSLIALGKPLIGLALLNPYDLLAFPELRTYLVTYEYTIPAITSAVRVLFGEQKPLGHLPISLPGYSTLEQS